MERLTWLYHRRMARTGDHRGAGRGDAVAPSSRCRCRPVVEHRRPDDGLLVVEQGSVLIESLAAMAVVFLILVIVVQLAFVLVAREVSQSAVDAAARRAARPAANLLVVQERLTEELEAVVPGAQKVAASVESVSGTINVRAAIEWAPPGPDLVPVVIRVESATLVVVPP